MSSGRKFTEGRASGHGGAAGGHGRRPSAWPPRVVPTGRHRGEKRRRELRGVSVGTSGCAVIVAEAKSLKSSTGAGARATALLAGSEGDWKRKRDRALPFGHSVSFLLFAVHSISFPFLFTFEEIN